MFQRVAIYGVGLIGGSIGLAVKEAWPKARVVGVGRSRGSLQKALRFRAIDTYTLDIARGFSKADLVVLAAPVEPVLKILQNDLPDFTETLLVTDVCSTKKTVVKSAEKYLPPHISFVGSHPIAGSEKSGCRAADKNLFQQRVTVLTPTARTDQPAVKKVRGFWKKLGSRTVLVSPARHDTLLALTSHLPHLLAAAASNLTSRLSAEEQGAFLGTGFRDFTRIARGSPETWEDIFLTNAEELTGRLTELERELAGWKTALAAKDRPRIRRLLAEALKFQEKLG